MVCRTRYFDFSTIINGYQFLFDIINHDYCITRNRANSKSILTQNHFNVLSNVIIYCNSFCYCIIMKFCTFNEDFSSVQYCYTVLFNSIKLNFCTFWGSYSKSMSISFKSNFNSLFTLNYNLFCLSYVMVSTYLDINCRTPFKFFAITFSTIKLNCCIARSCSNSQYEFLLFKHNIESFIFCYSYSFVVCNITFL